MTENSKQCTELSQTLNPLNKIPQVNALVELVLHILKVVLFFVFCFFVEGGVEGGFCFTFRITYRITYIPLKVNVFQLALWQLKKA